MQILSISKERNFQNRTLNASSPIKRPFRINVQNKLLNNILGDNVSFQGGLKSVDTLLNNATSGKYPKFSDMDKKLIKKLIKKSNLDYAIRLLNPKKILKRQALSGF